MIADTIDARLLSCADLVRAGAVLADIGTDHGYLPIFLLERGRISRAVLSDVNEGPLKKARENVEAAGLGSSCELVLTDGASALAPFSATDYTICGMGGELIADIIDEAPHLCDPDIRLILQPMSRQGHLRSYLYSHGFDILEERYSFDNGKYYVCMLAKFVGREQTQDTVTLELGPSLDHADDADAYIGFLERKRSSLLRTVEGKHRGGNTAEAEEALLAAIEERINKQKGK